MTPPREPADLAGQLLELLAPLQQWAVTCAQRAGAAEDVSLRQFAALHGIRHGATSPGELARRWQVTPAVLTGIIDRLERRGMVRRQPDPADRRRLCLVLTETGLAVSRRIERTLTQELAAQLATAPEDDLAALDRALDLLRRTVDALQSQAGPGGQPRPENVDEGEPHARDIPPPVRQLNSQPQTPGAGRSGGPSPSTLKDHHHMATNATVGQDATTTTAADPEHTTSNGVTPGVTELNLADPQFMATAYDTYADLREEGRVSRVRFGGGDTAGDTAEETEEVKRQRESLFVTHYDDVVATLLDPRFSVDPRSLMTPEQREQAPEMPEEFRPLARSIIGIDPPDHTRIRKLVQPSFTGRGMDALRPTIQATVDQLLDTAEDEAAARGEAAPNRRMDLVEALAYPFPVTVISDMLGIPADERHQLRGWTENLLRVDRVRGQEAEEEVRAGMREFIAYLKDLFARKRREPADDMISRLVLVEDDGEVLTEEENLATVFLMYLAGHVTTVNLVGNGVVALLTHPDQLAKVRSDPSLVKNVVEETLRYWGPVDFIGRRFANEDMDLAGAAVARGEQVMVSLAAANRDPERFANPDTFDISRENANRHLAFGKGIHVCLGAPLARIEGQIAFETLLRRYPDLRLAVPADEIQWSGSFLRGFRQVPLLF